MMQEMIEEMAAEIIAQDMTSQQSANFMRRYCELMGVEFNFVIMKTADRRVAELLN